MQHGCKVVTRVQIKNTAHTPNYLHQIATEIMLLPISIISTFLVEILLCV